MKIKKQVKLIKARIDKVINKLMKYKIVNFLLACITYFSICLQNYLPIYDLSSWLLFFVLIIVFTKTEVEKKYKKPLLLYSFLFGFLFMFGKLVYTFQDNSLVNVIVELFHFRYLLYFIGDFSIIFIILCYLFPFLYKNIKINNINLQKLSPRKVFVISFLVIFLAWIPYFISYYPGVLTPDSLVNVDIVMIKDYTLSNHHPITHSMLMVFLMKLGIKLFGSLVAGVATAIIFQMIIMAGIFAYTITVCYKLKTNKLLLFIILIIYSFIPIFGFYSITMWKDIMFGGFTLLLTIQLFKIFLLQKSNFINIKKLIPFIVISLLCLFFRNNAIYMYFMLILVILIIYKEYRKIFLISFTIVVGIYFFVEGPVLKYFKVEQTESSEYIAMPLQMVGRMAFKKVDFTKKEIHTINKLIPFNEVAKTYNPRTSDGIKFNDKYKKEVFDKNKADFLKLWIQLVIKHPTTAIEAYSNSTLGYWYPGVMYWAAATDTQKNNNYNLKNKAFLKPVKSLTLYLENRYTPIFNIEWSIGLCFWLISILLYVAITKFGYKILTIYMPVIGLWMTLMIASPVFAEFRYVFSAYTCLPLFVVLNYLKINDN